MRIDDSCKGCRESVRVTEAQIQEMLRQIIDNGHFEIATEDIYKDRLFQCHNCVYLEYGNTCLQCGCIIQIRARLKDETCPFPGKKKW